mgnify:FL=1
MRAIKEITEWDIAYRMPNHTYLVDGDKAIAYKPWHDGEAVYFDHPLTLVKSYRKFIELKDNPFDVKIKSNLIEVQGSKGDVYHVDPDKRSCTCTGYSFRGKCKHIIEALGE